MSDSSIFQRKTSHYFFSHDKMAKYITVYWNLLSETAVMRKKLLIGGTIMSNSYPVGWGKRKKLTKRRKKIPTQVQVQECNHYWIPDDFENLCEEVRYLRSSVDDMKRMKMEEDKKMSVSSDTLSTVFVMLVIANIAVFIYGSTQFLMAAYRRFSET